MAKFLKITAGQIGEEATVIVSAGVGDSGKAVSLDATGKLDTSVMPAGIGVDSQAAVASEILAANDFVSFFDNAGTLNVRKADNSNGRDCDGFVLAGFAAAASATVYLEGANSGLTGLTPGTRYYLGTSGAATSTAPTASGSRVQFLGKSLTATKLNFEPSDSVLLV